MNDQYTLCFLRTEVVKEGSRRFDAVEPLRTRVQVSYTPRSPCSSCFSGVGTTGAPGAGAPLYFLGLVRNKISGCGSGYCKINTVYISHAHITRTKVPKLLSPSLMYGLYGQCTVGPNAIWMSNFSATIHLFTKFHRRNLKSDLHPVSALPKINASFH